MAFKELSQEFKSLNDQYVAIGVDEWNERTKDVANRVWEEFRQVDIVDCQHLTDCIARSMVFWNQDRIKKTITKLWFSILKTDHRIKQDLLASLIRFNVSKFSKEEIKTLLLGIDKLDPKKVSPTTQDLIYKIS